MSKIKNFFSNITDQYKENIKKYTATNIVIILVTLIFVFGNYEVLGKFLQTILIIGSISTINLFTSETFFKDKTKKIISSIIGVAIAILFERLINFEQLEAMPRMVTGYCFIVFIIGLIKIIKDSNLELHEYIIKVTQNLLSNGIIYLILNIGLTIIISTAVTLLLDSVNIFDWLLRMQIALLGLFLIPSFLISITSIKNDISKFLRNIIVFVLMPLTILMTIIIYIYMCKIFLTREIPSNSIYRILAGLFIVAFPVWLTIYNFINKGKIIENFCKVMPVAFIPFIGLQIYSIGARCLENGITPIRYLGILFIIFEMIAIFLTLFKNRKYLLHILTTSIILILIATILPIVNMDTISKLSQSRRLTNAWKIGEEYNDLTEENKTIARSAYLYLKRRTNGEKYIPEYISEEEILNKDENLNDSYKISKRIKYSLPEYSNIYIKPYTYVQPVTARYYDEKNYSLSNLELAENININIESYIKQVINKNNTSTDLAKQYISENEYLKIDEKTDLYIQKLNITYEVEENQEISEIKYLYIEGYILTK